MFSKASNKPSDSYVPETAADEPRRGSSVPSIISPDLKIVGDLKSSGDIQVDGTVEGDITSRTLTIGEGAIVHGTLVAETVRIYGNVTGEVKASTVMLAKSARIQGNIAHQSLEMEAGASVVGQLSRLDKAKGASDSNVTVIKPDQDSNGAKSASAGYGSNGNGGSGGYARHP